MTDPNFVILYVKDPSASAAFYADVLGRTPVEASPTFVMFALSSGLLPIAQPPTAMDFGLTFVALDPDGHRLRVFAPATP